MLELILVRHGQTEWNLKRKVMGRQDVPLDATGRSQALALAQRFKGAKLDALITSPVERAFETAQIIAQDHPDLRIQKHEALIELDYGEWVNKHFEQLAEEHWEEWRTYRKDPSDMVFPGGESLREAGHRVGVFLDDVREQYAEGRVVFVSHADVIKLALLHLLELGLQHMVKFTIQNCAPCLVRIAPETSSRLILLSGLNGFDETAGDGLPQGEV